MDKRFSDDEENIYSHLEGEGDEQEFCEVCNLPYSGVCPINSPECPFRDAFADDEKTPDFEDVDQLDRIVGHDEEAERILVEAESEEAEMEEEDDTPS